MTTKGRKRRNILALVLIPIVLTCFCSTASAQQKPNLTPSPPPGCSSGASVVVKSPSCGSGCGDDSSLYNTDTLYFDWGVTNNGTAPTTTSAGIYIYVDEKLIINNGMAIPPLSVGQTSGCIPAGQGGGGACLNCPPISGLCPGDHTIRFVVDSLSTIAESEEADNQYSRTVTIASNPQPTPAVMSITLGGTYYSPWQLVKASNIPINASAIIQFSMSMDKSKSIVRFSDEYKNDIPGNVQWSKTCSDDDTVTFIPAQALRPGTIYQVHSQAWSIGGVGLTTPDNTFDFPFITKPSTADVTPPVVQTVYPYDGMTGVSTKPEIYIKFSEAMNPSSINNTTITLVGPGISGPDYNVFYDLETQLVRVNKNTPFTPSSEYTVTITPNVRDLRGNWLKEQYQWSFTTGEADTTPPTVLQTIPATGATNVSPFLYIHVVFSEEIDASTLTHKIHDNDFPYFDSSFNPYAYKDFVTFSPPISDIGPLLLTYGHHYTVTISGVKDLAGNSLSTPYSFSFTVAGESDDSAPVLLEGISPESQWGERWSDGSSRVKLELSASDDKTSPLTVTASVPPSYSWTLSPEDSTSVYSYKSTTGEGLPSGTHTLTFTIKDGASPQNNEVTFHRDIYILSQPTLISPTNGQSNVSTTPTFQWSYNETDRPFAYVVTVYDGPDTETARVVWQDFIIDKGAGTYSITIPADKQLAPNTTYYWGIWGQNKESTGNAYSAIWSFRTGGTSPPAPNFQQVIVRSDDRPAPTGLRWNLVAWVSGPSPADIVDLKVTGPAGFQYIFTEDDILQGEPLGLYFWRVVPNALSDGTYAFTVKDPMGRIATVNFDFVNTSVAIPRVNSPTMLPVDNSYVNTTTPTFSWTGVGPGYYYRLMIMDWNSKTDAVYCSDFTQDTQVTVPPGYLLPKTPYKWAIDVFDAPWNNRSRSDTFRFTTGSFPYTLDLSSAYVWSDNSYYNRFTKQLGAIVMGPLPNEVTQINVSGPSFNHNFIQSEIQYDLVTQGIGYGYGEGGFPANGTYTFNVQDKYSATDSLSKSQTSTAIPIVDQASLTPPNNAYLNSLTPTLRWAAVGGSNRYYRVKINDWMGRYTVYNSPRTTNPYATIPSGILGPNQSYKWRVEVFDDKDGLEADNRSSSGWNSFTIYPCPTPGTPSSPSPPDGAAKVSIKPTLNWAPCSDADSYDVYLGTSTDPPFVKNATVPSYSVSGLKDNMEYYWTIVAKNKCGNSAPGALWSFKTVVVSLPDLVETLVSSPPQGPLAQGNSFAVTDTVKNQGDVGAVASTTRYYLSEDTAKGSGDILLTGSRAVPALPVRATSTGKVTVKITAGTAAGAYYLLACTDDTGGVPEINEKNNCIASGGKVVVAYTDLVETSVSNPPPGLLTQGNSFSVTDTVKNQGNVGAVASTTRYYLSEDAVRGSGDILLTWSRAVPALPVGATSKGTVKVKVPAGAAAGAYYLLACTDDTGGVPETDEINNCIASGTTVVVSRPNLVELFVSNPPSGPLAQGNSFAVTDTVGNQGDVAAAASTTRYYLSEDMARGDEDILLTWSRAVPALPVGATSKGTVKVKVPAGAAAGAYYLLACTDDTGLVPETDETNNCIASGTTVVVSRPDLVETLVNSPPPGPLTQGNSFSVTDTVKNQGNVGAGASTTHYCLSEDAVRGDGDILLTGSRAVPALPSGATSKGTVKVKVPTGAAAGTYYLLACTDDMNVVAETDETNNCIASGTTVAVSRPDLVETLVSSPPPGPLTQGNSFSVTDTVKNQGNVGAGASTTHYYLSEDAVRGDGDILLTGSRAVPALPFGGTSKGTVKVKVPAGAAAGAYYLLACTDDTGLVPETDETNNCTASGTTVAVSRPDLVELFVSNPPPFPLADGSSFAVTDTVKNQGNVGAGASTTRYYLSEDTARGDGDILLTTPTLRWAAAGKGSRAVPALPAGGPPSMGTAIVEIPAVAAAGTYYLLACSDDTGLVPETDEKNNCIASGTTIVVTGPHVDLVELFVSNPPSGPLARGSSFAVIDTVENQGNLKAAASTTRYYLSEDAVRGDGDILLTGSRAVPALREWRTRWATSTGKVTVKIPAGTAAGAYYLLACTDDTGLVPETNETNNCIASESTVEVFP